MKKNNIFFVGDFESNTGPANVNKMIIRDTKLSFFYKFPFMKTCFL